MHAEPRLPRRERLLLLGFAALSFAPVVLYFGLFRRMYWFGDEFDLLDQADTAGLWRWIWSPFAENFVPVFKLLWRGAVSATGGSYPAMVVLLWLLHAANVALLGRLLRRSGLSWVATAAALVLFGLAPTHTETLTWTVQSSAILALLFMLLGLDAFVARPFRRDTWLWVALSALSFSRGVITGGLLALAALWPGAGGRRGLPRRLALAALYLAPAVAVAAIIAVYAGGNTRSMAGHWGAAAAFGTWYYCMNPGLLLLGVESRGWHTVAALGLVKVALIAWVLLRSRGSTRMVLALLVASDLANALLLGIGRYHTGLDAAMSSRYQYASLVGIAPLVGYWVDAVLSALALPQAGRRLAAAVGLAALAGSFLAQWRVEISNYSDWRGTTSRRLLLTDSGIGPHDVPGIPFMTPERARELIRIHNLH